MMRGRYLSGPQENKAEINVYADKSALILDWLLREGIKRKSFSLRELAQETGISVGLVQRVLKALVLQGLLQTKGMRTAKIFFFEKSKPLIENWLRNYSIVKKCKVSPYRSRFSGREELLNVLRTSKFSQKIVLALHAAADVYGCKNTNLDTLELYVLDPSIRSQLEEILQLEPQERGYEVLLIEPYYRHLLEYSKKLEDGIKVSPVLLTFLDLYHFPLRGQEQAEFMVERLSELKKLYGKGKDRAIRRR